MGFGTPAPSCKGKLKSPLVALAVLGAKRNKVPSRFSPTTALLPAVSPPVTQPLGEAAGSPVSNCVVRCTSGGGPESRTPGVGFGWGLSRSKTNPFGGDWKKVIGSLERMDCEPSSTTVA